MIKANDAFEFVVEDVWGNRSNPQEFIVAWSSISFDFAKLDICEEESKDKNVEVKLKRFGDIFQSVRFSTRSLIGRHWLRATPSNEKFENHPKHL